MLKKGNQMKRILFPRKIWALAFSITFIGCTQNQVSTLPPDQTNTPQYQYEIGMKHLKSKNYEAAIRTFKRAVTLDPTLANGHFNLGKAYLQNLQFPEAEESFARALSLKPTYSNAREEWIRAAQIRMVSPQTPTGKNSPYPERKIRRKRPELFDPNYRAPRGTRLLALRPVPSVTDIDGHPEKSAIQLVIRLQILQPFPDRTFRPNATLTRASFALALQEILAVSTGDEKIRTHSIGSKSPFPDVRGDHFAYNAILTTTTRGIMEANRKSGAFGLTKPVSGLEALISLKKVNEIF
jgi:tetratricopeptide (TPR) repeat protein